MSDRLTVGKCLPQQQRQIATETVVRKVALNTPTPGVAHLLTLLRRFEQRYYRGCDCIEVVRVNREARVANDLCASIVRRSHARQTVRHCFQIDESETFAATRQREERRRPV